MFDLFHGLPVHILVVHAVVVLLPLMALVSIAFTVRPRWRPGLPWAILGNVGVVGAAFVAVKSGGLLQDRLSAQVGREVAKEHSQLGAVLPYFAIGVLVASVIAYLLVRPRSAGTRGVQESGGGGGVAVARPTLALAIALVLVAGLAATFWTYRVGDSGATAVWKDTIANTKAP